MGTKTYTALQLHFHWAAPGSTKGSEHTVNGKHYDAEMHIVHMKDPYKSVDQIKDMPDGLTVLGVFLSVEDDVPDNAPYQRLFDAIKHCSYQGDEAVLGDGPPLISLLPPSQSFYRYSGSLTTPPCYEAVVWTVFQEPVAISRAQLEVLQSLKPTSNPSNHHKRSADEDDDATLSGNFRPTQPLHGRIVTSFLDIGFQKAKEDSHWTYHGHGGTGEWAGDYPVCDGDKQSPINVISTEAKAPGEDSHEVKALSFSGYENALAGKFINNGHSVQLNFGEKTSLVTEGGLDDSYTALQLHFHWGKLDSDGELHGGSEHTLDDKRYPAEMHIVHGRTSYLSELSAFQKNSSNTYTVLGVFVDVHDDGDEHDNDAGSNEDMQKLFDAIEKVQFSGKSTEFANGPTLASLLPDSKAFYRYEGSLTTPPCSEAVIWTLFEDPVRISRNQFIAFQRLFSAEMDDVTQANSIGKMMTNHHVDARISNEKDKENPALPESGEEGDADSEADDSESPSVRVNSAILPSGNHDTGDNDTAKYMLRDNYRPVQPVNGRTVYYYSSAGPQGEPAAHSGPPVLEIVLCTIAGVVVFIIMIAVGMRCCCKKDKKTEYKAARRTEGDVINM